MSSKKSKKIIYQFLIIGFLIGIIYLLIAIFYELLNSDLEITFNNILLVQRENKLLHIADSLPFILMLMGYFVGIIIENNISQNKLSK